MIDTPLLISALLAGATNLGRQAALLDRINVFPVVDGDTGRNMDHTLGGLVSRLDSPMRPSDQSIAQLTCPALLQSAQGNSGVILSQFLIGFLEHLDQTQPLTERGFTEALTVGSDLAHRSVSDPQPGTMLTTMADLATLLNTDDTISDLAAHGRFERKLAASVAKTKEQLPCLAQANVVDAGALGFYIFASNLTLVLPASCGDEQAQTKIAARRAGQDEAPMSDISGQIDPQYLAAVGNQPPDYRYCVNLLFELESKATQHWRKPFEALASSIEAVTHGAQVKLHLHANKPDLIVATARRIGRVLDHSVEDMAAQLERRKAPPAITSTELGQRFRVVGDSAISLPYELAAENGIARFENRVMAHGKSFTGQTLDREKLFANMRAGHQYTTAMTSPAEITQFFDEQLTTCEHLFYLAVGKAYSGTQELVKQTLASHPQRDRLTIVDTRAASGQQGLICLAAAQHAKQAKTRDQVGAFIDRQITGCREYLVIDDLKYLTRTGRIGKIKAAFAGVLSLKPIVGHGDHGAITHAKVRSHRAALTHIADRIQERPSTGQLLIMVEYTDNRDWATRVAAHLQSLLPSPPQILLAPLSATSAVHMGPGTWGITVTDKN